MSEEFTNATLSNAVRRMREHPHMVAHSKVPDGVVHLASAKVALDRESATMCGVPYDSFVMHRKGDRPPSICPLCLDELPAREYRIEVRFVGLESWLLVDRHADFEELGYSWELACRGSLPAQLVRVTTTWHRIVMARFPGFDVLACSNRQGLAGSSYWKARMALAHGHHGHAARFQEEAAKESAAERRMRKVDGAA